MGNSSVLPSKPKIVDAELKGTFDYETCCYCDSAKLYVTFTSRSMKNLCFVNIVSEDSIYISTFPKNYSFVFYPIDDYLDNSIGHSFHIDGVDWGQFYYIISDNDYGRAYSDTILSTNLIKDPNIIYAIEDLNNQSTDIKNNNLDAIDNIILYKNNKIYLNSIGHKLPIKIFNQQGYIVLNSTISDYVDMSFLPKGIYYVKVSLPTIGSSVSCKIVKL